MPGALVELARRPGYGDSDEACDQVRRAGEDEGDGGVEAEGFDDRGELHASLAFSHDLVRCLRALTKFLNPFAARLVPQLVHAIDCCEGAQALLEMRHQREQPHHGISQRLTQTVPHTDLALVASDI